MKAIYIAKNGVKVEYETTGRQISADELERIAVLYSDPNVPTFHIPDIYLNKESDGVRSL